MSKHELYRMTWKEIEDVYTKDPVILIPLGSTEQQGPHTPTGDYRCAEAVTKAVAEEADAYCTTCIPFGYSEYFRGFPGSISLQPQTLIGLLHDICYSFLDHGVKRIMFFNGHAGNDPVLDRVSRIILRDRGIMIPNVNLWALLKPDFRKSVFGDLTTSGHGAEPLTSMSTFLFPEDMRMDLLKDITTRSEIQGMEVKTLAKVAFEDMEFSLFLNMEDISPDGVMGNPWLSSAENGKKLFAEVVRRAIILVEKWKTVDTKWPSGKGHVVEKR
jgi:creatinine amidohydrolase